MSNDKERKFYDKIIKMREQYKQSKPIQSNTQNDTMYSDEYIKAIRFFIRIKNGFAELHKNKKS